ncbi:hypothetical protein CFK37_18190 [Virgibacillus phasianinus]|uniref:DUF2569 domain-containing protein n=1 Tax=Virgibacillus phasianinus TaxID=2017483 RepID=A0A220U774_9BACI|nr:hypothetical protein [Virgibacillus phasianinus]ASK63950.1 hypothetical protein CFK37_18190 [Virgibacillus phasianinus]
MKFFLKLNVVSLLYAVMIFIPLELMINVYRISRLTDWEISSVNALIGITIIVEIIAGSIIFIILTKKWMNGRKASFWTVILWAPYFVLFVYLFASLFPITYGGDAPNPVTGLLAIGAVIAYPVYILIINFAGMVSYDDSMRTT